MPSFRQQENQRIKASLGYRIWSVAFTLFYPFIAVFTFVFTLLVSIFSGLSQGMAWLLKGGKRI
ncbi:MAG: hypothetical protein ACK4GN_05590 [Runella sp.]